MTTRWYERLAEPYPSRIDRPGKIVNPKRKNHLRKAATSTPTWYMEPHHCPEAGIGGSAYSITYRGDLIGYAYSMWDAEHGVHFRVRDTEYQTVTVEGGPEPRAFESRAECANYLLDIAGIDLEEPIDYDQHKGPRGGGRDRPDRRY